MVSSRALLSGLAGLVAVQGSVAASDVIKDDAHFYGQSPPVYPSRKAPYSCFSVPIETLTARWHSGNGGRHMGRRLQQGQGLGREDDARGKGAARRPPPCFTDLRRLTHAYAIGQPHRRRRPGHRLLGQHRPHPAPRLPWYVPVRCREWVAQHRPRQLIPQRHPRRRQVHTPPIQVLLLPD